MCVARPGDERPELEGTEAKAEGEEGDLGLRGPGEGAREEKRENQERKLDRSQQ